MTGQTKEQNNLSHSIPIVFVHKGDSWYLPYVLRQALAVNHNSDVALLSNGTHNSEIDGVEVCSIDDLQTELVQEFYQNYQHISTNSPDYEIFCWLRWFYLLAYMESKGISQAMYLDSDVLIFTSPKRIVSLYPEIVNKCAFVIPQQSHDSYYWCAGGHVSYWTQETLRKFCQFTIDTFYQQDLLNMYYQKWNWHIHHKVAGGICDMTTLYLFSREYSHSVVNLLAINRDGNFDMNFNSRSNFLDDEYEMQHNHKKVILQNNQILGIPKNQSPVPFHNIHFQGWTKQFIPNYYQGQSFKEKTKHYFDRIFYTLQVPVKTKLKPAFVRIKLFLKELFV